MVLLTLWWFGAGGNTRAASFKCMKTVELASSVQAGSVAAASFSRRVSEAAAFPA
ncbi:MAG: hypothetical protein ACKO85_16815 [Isosphaeraceae bacterium]